MTNLRFADDVLLIAKSLTEIKAMILDMSLSAGKVGLKLHPGKTKILSNATKRRGEEANTTARIGEMSVEALPFEASTKYLGRSISFCKPHDTEMHSRIRRAWTTFHTNKEVLCNKAYGIRQRVKLFDKLDTPSVLYGSGCWVVPAESTAMLQKAQRRMLRSMFQYGRKSSQNSSHNHCASSSSESSQEILPEVDGEELEPWHTWLQRVTHEIEHQMDKVGVVSLVEAQRNKYFRWAGHVARYTDGRWTSTVERRAPEGGRAQGGTVACSIVCS